MKKIYIEISDICGLKCSFCPTPKGIRGIMDLVLFKKAILEAKKHTNLIALHILGDPLKVENLQDYLCVAKNANLSVEITTSGVFLDDFNMLINPPIKQINFSLDAINGLKNRDVLLRKIFAFCDFKIEQKSDIFINLRVQKRAKNKALVAILERQFNTTNLTPHLFHHSQNRIKLGNKIIIDFREIFAWDSNADSSVDSQCDSNMDSNADFRLDSKKTNPANIMTNHTFGTCLAFKNHIGILSNGQIVPCCIDTQGILSLGNIASISIESALKSKKAQKMQMGFQNNVIYEPFCKVCDYRKQFTK